MWLYVWNLLSSTGAGAALRSREDRESRSPSNGALEGLALMPTNEVKHSIHFVDAFDLQFYS